MEDMPNDLSHSRGARNTDARTNTFTAIDYTVLLLLCYKVWQLERHQSVWVIWVQTCSGDYSQTV